ncbi:MAG: hypothetical protein KAH23_00470 [Kiritimatiellae bacterium]|nr:hypothetical protein [Kiritimatiellia bacterium]
MKTKTITFIMMLVLGITYLGVTFVAAQGRGGATPPPPSASTAKAPAANPAAQPAAQPVAPPAAPVNDGTGKEETISLTDEMGSAATTNGEGRISISLTDVEMDQVVMMFTQISGANILATPSNLQGRVTVNLNDVEWKPALESILDMHSLMLMEKVPGSEVYSIVKRIPGAPIPMVVDTIFLKYASATHVNGVLKSMLAGGGKISSFSSRNALVIRSTAGNIEEMKQVVEAIDILRPQVFIEAKFLELNDEAIKDLGINWQILQGYSVTAGNLSWDLTEDRTWSESRDDSQTQWDNRGQTDTITKSYDAFGNLLTPAAAIQDQTDSIDKGKDISSDISKTFDKDTTDLRSAVLGLDDFRVVLSALKQMNGVSIVSNPKIVVANEEPATIHIGETERPFVSSVTPGQQGIAPVVTYNPGDPVDFGVKLTVTPTINTESNITVKIEPQLTRMVRNAIAPNGQTFPVIATKTITTTFCLESGKTVAIGGMTDTEDRDETTKIPLLGDIPILGKYLFSHTHKVKRQKETIVFVTVSLANPGVLQENDGLPENAELTPRHRLRTKALRQKSRSELEELSAKSSEKTEDDERRMKRLLRRRR